jgi:hypothetical protein
MNWVARNLSLALNSFIDQLRMELPHSPIWKYPALAKHWAKPTSNNETGSGLLGAGRGISSRHQVGRRRKIRTEKYVICNADNRTGYI